MKTRLILLVAAAAAFGLGPLEGRLGPVWGAALLILLGVLLALAASGTLSAIAAASGALGAFASGVLLATSPAAAGAVLVGLCYGERTLRVRGPAARAAHLGVALVGGALAGLVTARYLAAGPAVQAVVLVVTAVLVALPLLVEADDPLAYALGLMAGEVDEPAATALAEGAELCRTVGRTVDSDVIDKQEARQAGRTWRALLRLGQARVRLQRSRQLGLRIGIEPAAGAAPVVAAAPPQSGELAAAVTEESAASAQPGPSSAEARTRRHRAAVIQRLDAKIVAHVSALARMYTAVNEAQAVEVSLDDGAMRSVESHGESLEQVSRAIVEEV